MKRSIVQWWQCVCLGVVWMWREQRDFIYIVAVLGLAGVSLGLFVGNATMAASGAGVLVMLILWCLLCGSFLDGGNGP